MRQQGSTMKKITAITLLSISILFTACQKKDEQKAKPIAGVTILTVKSADINMTTEATATTEASKFVQLRARVDGYLNSIDYTEGSFVRSGETLFTLDPKPLEATLKIAKGTKASADANYQNAKRNLDRIQPLFEANAVSRQEYDTAVATELSTKAALQSAEASVALAELNLGYTSIKSPITGMSDKAAVHVGNYISPSTNGLLTTISQIDPIYINFQITENQYLSMNQAGQNNKESIVKVTTADGKPYAENGKVSFCSPSFDTSTGTMNCRAEVKNPNGKLRPGEFVRIKVGSQKPQKVILVPQKALLQGQKGRFVYVIKDNHATPRPVVLGEWIGDKAVILQGLMDNDIIAVDGIAKVMPNSEVKVLGNAETKSEQNSSTPQAK